MVQMKRDLDLLKESFENEPNGVNIKNQNNGYNESVKSPSDITALHL